MTPQGRRRTAALAVVTAIVLAGCAESIPVPQPEDAPDQPGPALTVQQEQEVKASIADVLTTATEEQDSDLLETRVSGPADAMRTAELKAAKAADDPELVTALPTETQQDIIPASDEWPRVGMSITVAAEDAQSPRLIVTEQADARSNYSLWAWVRLFPDTTLPAFAAAEVGSPVLAPDTESLLISPADAVTQYADVLNLGGDSEFADTFGDDPYRSRVESTSEVQSEAMQGIEGTYTNTFSVIEDQTPRTMGTADGGAVVVGAVKSVEKFEGPDGSTISPPQTDTAEALFGDADASETLNITSLTTVAIYVPPAGSEETVQVLGAENVTTKVAP
ncbi:hypothetical protein [Paraoerskovia marina]|uniref:hypothetical protein n=1 Tax=Paraoerskovia marina TaxID=545619 RepID=UPI0004922AB6|nr:hypothetical protein [Paraoerskovia marina]